MRPLWIDLAWGVPVAIVMVLACYLVTRAGSAEPAEVQYKLQLNLETGEMAPVAEIAIDPLPEDPCQRCAVKALRGDYNPLRTWQRYVYQYILDHNITVQGYAKLTGYGYHYESERGQNEWTSCGSHVHTAGCSANPEIPLGTLIWTPYGVRYVNDRGGAVKLRNTRRDESANFDYWTFGNIGRRHVPYAIVKARGDRSVWMISRQQWPAVLAAAGGDVRKAEAR